MRYPIRDAVAIVGVGSTGFSRSSARSMLDMTTEAAITAILDAGLTKNDIDGLAGTMMIAGAPTVSPMEMGAALGLERVTYFSHAPVPIVFSLMDAMAAVYSGACETVLIFHGVFRSPRISKSAGGDAIRATKFAGLSAKRWMPGLAGGDYAAWAKRYMEVYGVDREGLARVAVNGRSWAVDNPLAVWREPIDFDTYYAARMVREPLGLFDMDTPVDGADAFVITTAERARDLAQPAVLVHAASSCLLDRNADCGELLDLDRTAADLVAEDLRSKSELWVDDSDFCIAYDGFSIIALNWLESFGWCGRGEASAFLCDNWDNKNERARLGARGVPLNPHGGSLSEGGTQGSGHLRESVVQLRGQAGARQVPDAKAAVVAIGGLYMNAQGVVLRR